MTIQGTTGTATDAVELLTADHRVLGQLFHQLDLATATDAVENQRDLAQRIVRELSVHAAVEEQLLYPAIRTALEDGERLADHALEEHAEVKHLLVELDRTRPHEDGFASMVTALIATVEQHVTEEEGLLLPQLAETLGPERLMELGEAMQLAKATAPTRPHPHVPDRPPGNVVAGAVTAFTDRVRDAVRDVTAERS
jgi:hemerythrin superfamily protein